MSATPHRATLFAVCWRYGSDAPRNCPRRSHGNRGGCTCSATSAELGVRDRVRVLSVAHRLLAPSPLCASGETNRAAVRVLLSAVVAEAPAPIGDRAHLGAADATQAAIGEQVALDAPAAAGIRAMATTTATIARQAAPIRAMPLHADALLITKRWISSARWCLLTTICSRWTRRWVAWVPAACLPCRGCRRQTKKSGCSAFA